MCCDFINNFVVIKYKADIAMQISNVSFVYFNCDYICNNLNTGNPFFSVFQINISAEHCKKRIYQNTNAAVSTTEDTTPMSMCAATLFFTCSIFPVPKC